MKYQPVAESCCLSCPPAGAEVAETFDGANKPTRIVAPSERWPPMGSLVPPRTGSPQAPPKGSSRNSSWFKAGAGGSNEPPPNATSLADHLSYSMIAKPFKDDKIKKGPRRNKPLKQILAAERLRAKHVSDVLLKNNPTPDEDVEMTAAPDEQQPNSNDQQQQSQSQPAVNKKARREILGPVNPDVNYNTYMIIEAPPSVIPPKKYCDITGLEAPYIDPKSRLRYHNAEVYELIRTFVSSPFEFRLDQSHMY
ncbi:chromatin-remodeling complex subunit ies6 [Puccinia graminis f. sp. tritici]|uniref:Chromatin-remodeling complex subunit ies6 n=1 Tax=Puccinia graminis f. sp. tritici TaxID=56615 RepID=A0A5B0NSQ5_PUCGR|nr:chromatin-remodeling complex subunit ies6 [Puccinia graminis f. sp. tritici]